MKQKIPLATDLSEEEIRQKILTEIEKIKIQIAQYKDQSQPVALDNAIGRLSRMDAINNKSITESALRQAEIKLQKLNQALDQIGKKDFGIF